MNMRGFDGVAPYTEAYFSLGVQYTVHMLGCKIGQFQNLMLAKLRKFFIRHGFSSNHQYVVLNNRLCVRKHHQPMLLVNKNCMRPIRVLPRYLKRITYFTCHLFILPPNLRIHSRHLAAVLGRAARDFGFALVPAR